MKTAIKFKNFAYSLEMRIVTGETVEGKTVKGTINSDLKIEFSLKNISRQVLFFVHAEMNQDKKSMKGTYGFSKDKIEGTIEIFKEDDNPNKPACVCNCLKCRKTLTVETIKLDNWVCDVCHHVKDKGS